MVLPSSLFESLPSQPDFQAGDLITSYNLSGASEASTGGQITSFKRVVILMFTPYTISGLPLLGGVIIAFINYICALIGGIWLYEKLVKLIP